MNRTRPLENRSELRNLNNLKILITLNLEVLMFPLSKLNCLILPHSNTLIGEIIANFANFGHFRESLSRKFLEKKI